MLDLERKTKTRSQRKREKARAEMIRSELSFFERRNRQLMCGDSEQREQAKRGLKVERRLRAKLRELAPN